MRSLLPFVHLDSEQADSVLRAEAKAHLESSAALQAIAEILVALRVANVSWWSPEQLRTRWSAAARMQWFEQRADLRQEITTALTGLLFNTARRKSPAFQAELIDSVIEDSAIGAEHFEGAFDPRDVAVYGPVAGLWSELMAAAPWHEEIPGHITLVTAMLTALTAEKSAQFAWVRLPILNAWDVRMAIGPRAWNAHMPLEVRVAIDSARLAREDTRPLEPFHAKDELMVATPKVLAESLGLRDLRGVFEAAGEAMGLARAPIKSDVVLKGPEEEVPRATRSG
jgi:hypothetical protein